MSEAVGTDAVALKDATDLAALRDLIQRSRLKAIEYHEVSARLTAGRTEETSGEANIDFDLQYRKADDVFGFRLLANLTTDFGEASVGVAVVYDYEGELQLRPLLNFGNEVAVMTVFPYVREAVGSITAKVFGEPFLLPLMERGDVAFDLEEPTE